MIIKVYFNFNLFSIHIKLLLALFDISQDAASMIQTFMDGWIMGMEFEN